MRNNKGCIICPPSRYHKNGHKSVIKSYEWINHPETTQLAEMPKWLFHILYNNPRIRCKEGKGIEVVKKSNNVPKIKESTENQGPSLDLGLMKKIVRLDLYKSYSLSDALHYIFYRDSVCYCCNKKHNRRDGQYFRVETSLNDIIRLVFKCFHNTELSNSFWITRMNPHVKKYSTERLRKRFDFDDKDVSGLMKYVPSGIFEIMIHHNVNCIDKFPCKKINKEYLSSQDFDFINFDTVLMKSIEGSNKTNGFLDLIKTNELRKINIKKYIIANANVSTLSSIHNECTEKKIDVVYYEKASVDEIKSARVLLITLNSLHKILDDSGFVSNPKNIMLIMDETSVCFKYMKSDTLNKSRHLCAITLEQLIMFSGKLCLIDADLSDITIKIALDIRKKRTMIIYNQYKHIKPEKVRHYQIKNTTNELFDSVKQSLNDDEKIVILSDSKRLTDMLYIRSCLNIWGSDNDEVLEREFSNFSLVKDMYNTNRKYQKLLDIFEKDTCVHLLHNDSIFSSIFIKNGVMLINSENNNSSQILRNLNNIIVKNNIRILICSPSLSVGTNIKIKYFDRLFGLFKGKSVDYDIAQQQLNRVRTFKQSMHYIHCMNPVSNCVMIDDDLIKKYITDIRKQMIQVKRDNRKSYLDMMSELGLKVVDKKQSIKQTKKLFGSFIDDDLDYDIDKIDYVDNKNGDMEKKKIFLTEAEAIKAMDLSINMGDHPYMDTDDELDLQNIKDDLYCDKSQSTTIFRPSDKRLNVTNNDHIDTDDIEINTEDVEIDMDIEIDMDDDDKIKGNISENDFVNSEEEKEVYGNTWLHHNEINNSDYSDNDYDDNDLDYKIAGFAANAIAYATIVQTKSKANFFYYFLSNIVQRGHKIYLENKPYKLAKELVKLDKKCTSITDDITEFMLDMKADEFVDAPLITKDKLDELELKKKNKGLTKLEQNMMGKYYFFDRYHVISDVDSEKIKNFYIDAIQNNYLDKAFRLKQYLKNIYYDNSEEDTMAALSKEVMNTIKKLIKMVGFTDLLDTNTISFVTTEEVTGFDESMIKQIRTLFINYGDWGRFRGKNKRINILNLLDRILDNLFGVNIKYAEPYRKTEKGVVKYMTNSHIDINPIVFDYLVIKSKDSNVPNKIASFCKGKKFTQTDIHGQSGKYRGHFFVTDKFC